MTGSFSGGALIIRREQLHPQGFFKLVIHKEGIVLCLHPLFNVTPVQGGESLQLLTPTKCTVAFFSTSTDAVWAWCPGHR